MANIFFVSDTHFHHANILKFIGDDETLIRPGFENVDAMNEHMTEQWNSVVRDGDKVYHQGDVSFKYGSDLAIVMSRLRGRKRLLLGNHDRLKGTNLMDWFEKVELWRIWKDEKFICTHVPIRIDQMRYAVANVHGHIHQNKIPDPHYINVCVERTGYKPMAMEEITAAIRPLL